MAERSTYLNGPRTGEERTIKALVAVSLLVHLFLFIVMTPGIMRKPMPVYEEWEIETQLVADFDMAAPKVDTLPNAEESKEAKVPETLLPQLPKKFAIDDKAKGETLIEEGEASKEEKTEKIAQKKEAEKPVPEQNQDEKNRLKKEDAIRRLAIERLRNEQKFSSKLQAEKQDAIARLKQKAASNKDINIGAVGNFGAGSDKYMGRLQVHIRRCYEVPTAYNLANAKLKVSIAMVLNERGGLMSSRIQAPSGDHVFDELAFNAVKKCSPLPPPPTKLAGASIIVNFTP